MAIKLTTGNRIAETSSKGNQEKWQEDGRWFKLDMFGYEGLAETVTSALLSQTNIIELGFQYVTYRMERLEVHGRTRNGCSSADFLQSGESILTLADLLRKGVGSDWQSQVKRLPNMQAKIKWMVEQIERLTGLDRFGVYLTALFETDMLFGNEDRHLNNIAVLRRFAVQIGKRVKVHGLAEVDGIEYLNPIVCMHKSISDLKQGRTFRVSEHIGTVKL